MAYLRSHLTGYTASTPIVIGGGMNNTEFSSRPVNDALFQANLNGTHKRLDYVGTFDTINPRYGFSTGLPVPQVDSFHATRAGALRGSILQLGPDRFLGFSDRHAAG